MSFRPGDVVAYKNLRQMPECTPCTAAYRLVGATGVIVGERPYDCPIHHRTCDLFRVKFPGERKVTLCHPEHLIPLERPACCASGCLLARAGKPECPGECVEFASAEA